MHILLATDSQHAADSHTLTIRMCEEMGYEERPEREAFIQYVLFEQAYMAIFVAYNEKNHPVGQVIMTRGLDPYIPGYFGVMKTLYVIPDYRKAGVADALADALMSEAPRRGYKGVQWYVYKNNMPSLKFFARRGVEPKEQEDLFEFWHPVATIAA